MRVRLALAATLPRPCPYCGELVLPGQLWDVDHQVKRVDGGPLLDPGNLRPAHVACNRRDGAEVMRKRARRLRVWPPP